MSSAAVQRPMFFFFSNRMGCIGSLLITVVGTLIIFALLGWINVG